MVPTEGIFITGRVDSGRIPSEAIILARRILVAGVVTNKSVVVASPSDRVRRTVQGYEAIHMIRKGQA